MLEGSPTFWLAYKPSWSRGLDYLFDFRGLFHRHKDDEHISPSEIDRQAFLSDWYSIVFDAAAAYPRFEQEMAERGFARSNNRDLVGIGE